MRQYLSNFKQYPLFARISEEELTHVLTCLRAQVVFCEKGRIILHQGEPAKSFGVVLEGCVHVTAGDMGGNHTLVTLLSPGELFAETFACAQINALPVSVVAAEECRVLMFEHARVVTGCRNGCMAHSILVTNLMRIISSKNLLLNQRLRIVTQRTTREKLMTYLHVVQEQAGANPFSIPFDRQGLADFLGVERSALSAEIGKLKKAGVIDCRKNEFEFLNMQNDGSRS